MSSAESSTEAQLKKSSCFPIFDDGDVEIRLSESSINFMILHARVLSEHSPVFEAGLSERWTTSSAEAEDKKKKKKKRKTDTPRRVYELRFDNDSAFGMLSPAHTELPNTEMLPKSNGEFPHLSPYDEGTLERRRIRCLEAHACMLCAMYGEDLKDFWYLPNEEKCRLFSTLADIADAYGCGEKIRTFISDQLWKAFSTSATESYWTRAPHHASGIGEVLRLSIKLELDWLFRSAARGIVGLGRDRWELAFDPLQELGVSELMQSKRTELVGLLKQLDLDLLCPWGHLDETRDSQLAHCIYTLWLIGEFRDGQGSGMRLGYGDVYLKISDGELQESFDDRDVAWLGFRFEDACSTLEADAPRQYDTALQAILGQAKIKVDSVLMGEPQDDLPRFGYPFTAVRFEDSELPWAED